MRAAATRLAHALRARRAPAPYRGRVASATPMRRFLKDSGLPKRRRSLCGHAQRVGDACRSECRALRRRRRSPRTRPVRARRVSTGRPRIARAWSSNSLCACVHIVTMPVSCGRGLTSENQTSSPLTNSSTPKMPRPPRSAVTLPAMSRALRQRDGRHRLRLPRLDVVAVDLHVADRLAEVRLDLAVGGPARAR